MANNLCSYYFILGESQMLRTPDKGQEGAPQATGGAQNGAC